MKRAHKKKTDDEKNEQGNAKKRKKVLFLQLSVLFVCFGVILIVAIVFRQNFLEDAGGDSADSFFETENLSFYGEETQITSFLEPLNTLIHETSDESVEITEFSEQTSEPSLPMPTELLPENPLVEDYFGALPVPESVEPVRHFEARAIYIGMLGFDDAIVELIQDTHINSVVIDLKESDGVKYNTTNPLAIEIDAISSGSVDLKTVVEQYHDIGIKVIGRIVCFKDVILAEKIPERSIKGQSGAPLFFSTEDRKSFISPYDMRNWDYNIELAVEAIEAGVDEIQFDYVRFPVGGTTTGERPYFGDSDVTPQKHEVIDRFLQTARIRIQDEYGVPLSADVFGIILSGGASGDNLGQNWDTIGLTGISAVCPMIYPSHYALNSGLNGHTFSKPDLQPYDVVYHALLDGKTTADMPGFSVVRPYLQAFTASWIGSGNYLSPYGYEPINAQVKAVYDAGYKEWILWNPGGYYPNGAYDGT